MFCYEHLNSIYNACFLIFCFANRFFSQKNNFLFFLKKFIFLNFFDFLNFLEFSWIFVSKVQGEKNELEEDNDIRLNENCCWGSENRVLLWFYSHQKGLKKVILTLSWWAYTTFFEFLLEYTILRCFDVFWGVFSCFFLNF